MQLSPHLICCIYFQNGYEAEDSDGLLGQREVILIFYPMYSNFRISYAMSSSSFCSQDVNRHRYGSASTVEANGMSDDRTSEAVADYSVIEPEPPFDVHLGHPFRESSSMTSSSTGASSCEPSSSTARQAGPSVVCQPRKQALPRKVTIQLQSNSIQDDGEDDVLEEDVAVVG